MVLNFFPWLFALKSVFLSQPIPSSSGYCWMMWWKSHWPEIDRYKVLLGSETSLGNPWQSLVSVYFARNYYLKILTVQHFSLWQASPFCWKSFQQIQKRILWRLPINSQDNTLGCRSRLQVLTYMEEGWVNVGVLLRGIRSLYLMKFFSTFFYQVLGKHCFPCGISLFPAKNWRPGNRV